MLPDSPNGFKIKHIQTQNITWFKNTFFSIKSTRCVVLISILSYSEFMTQLILEIIAHGKFNWRRQ